MATQAKITDLSHQIVQEISSYTGEKQIDIIEDALKAYERAWLIERINSDYSRLRKNKKLWKEELKFRAELEGTLLDGKWDE